MSPRQFWTFLDLDFIYNTTFGKAFYKTVCEYGDESKGDYLRFLDENKFMHFIAFFTKTHKLESNKTFLN